MRTDNFKIMREILTALELQMDSAVVDWPLFSCDALGCSQERWLKLMTMMSDAGLLKGFSFTRKPGDQIILDMKQLRLTLAGLRYLQDAAL